MTERTGERCARVTVLSATKAVINLRFCLSVEIGEKYFGKSEQAYITNARIATVALRQFIRRIQAT